MKQPALTKRCVTCKKEKDKDQFSDSAGVNKTGERRKDSICKHCRSQRTMKWQSQNRERYNKYMREYNLKKKKSTQNTSV